jgi:hypothetical protein
MPRPRHVGRAPGDEERGGRVEEHDVTRGARLAAEDAQDDRAVELGIATGQRVARRVAQAELGRIDRQLADHPTLDQHRPIRAGQ